MAPEFGRNEKMSIFVAVECLRIQHKQEAHIKRNFNSPAVLR